MRWIFKVILSVGLFLCPHWSLIACEFALFFAPVDSSASPSSLEPFIGGDDEESLNIDAMRDYGFAPSVRLLQRHADLVEKRSSVLEIGPYYNPLLPELLKINSSMKGIFWEYDQGAARSLSRVYKNSARVFRADLSDAPEELWNHALGQSIEALGSLVDSKEGTADSFDTLLLSSVLNYVDFKQLFEKVLARMSDNALVVLCNTNKVPAGSPLLGRVPSSLYMLEYLLQKFGERMLLLPGFELSSNSFLSLFERTFG